MYVFISTPVILSSKITNVVRSLKGGMWEGDYGPTRNGLPTHHSPPAALKGHKKIAQGIAL